MDWGRITKKMNIEHRTSNIQPRMKNKPALPNREHLFLFFNFFHFPFDVQWTGFVYDKD